jgi:hypothetical protein
MKRLFLLALTVLLLGAAMAALAQARIKDIADLEGACATTSWSATSWWSA